jgi:hypothetical protein
MRRRASEMMAGIPEQIWNPVDLSAFASGILCHKKAAAGRARRRQ